MSALDQSEFAFNQPAGPGSFVVFENAGRSELFELLLQTTGKFDRGDRLENHCLSWRGDIVAEDGGIDTKWTDINCLGGACADATVVGHHVDTVLRIA